MESVKYSIIVPVYNAEQFLERCIKSLIGQTYKNFEVIFINDGSSDTSGDILKKYCTSDKRLKLIERTNQGVSSARNEGIERAIGEYVIFVDADDYVEKNLLEKISECSSKAEMIMYNFKDNGIVNKVEKEVPPFCDDVSESAILISGLNSFRGFVWNKAFKRNIVIKNDIKFKDDIHMCEDLCFCIDFLEKNITTAFILEPLYYYEHRGVSASANIFSAKRFSVIKAYDYLLSKPLIRGEKTVYRCYKHQYIRHCLSLWKMIRNDDENVGYKKELSDRIKKVDWKFAIDKSFNIKYRLVFVAIKILG